MFFVARAKVKLKIEKNVNFEKKVLQNGYKYPQNSSMSFFSINFIALSVNFNILDCTFFRETERSHIFVQDLSNSQISWHGYSLRNLFFCQWNATAYSNLFTIAANQSFTKSSTKTFVFVFVLYFTGKTFVFVFMVMFMVMFVFMFDVSSGSSGR